jgi:beta-lactamase superfamily II metal-dependent hydrolase
MLIAPGHGIHAVPEFAIAARPEVTIASVHARYGKGIPAHKVYGNVGSKVLVTGLDGSVQLVADGQSYTVKVLAPAGQAVKSGSP